MFESGYVPGGIADLLRQKSDAGQTKKSKKKRKAEENSIDEQSDAQQLKKSKKNKKAEESIDKEKSPKEKKRKLSNDAGNEKQTSPKKAKKLKTKSETDENRNADLQALFSTPVSATEVESEAEAATVETENGGTMHKDR